MWKRVETGIAGIIFLIVSVIFMATACGGQDSSGSETASQIAFSSSGHALPADIIDARIDMYEELLAAGALSESDLEIAQSLVDDYGKIKAALEGEVSETYYREITHILFDGVRMLEEKCLGSAAADKPREQAPEGNPQPLAESDTPGPALPPPMMDSMAAGLEDLLAGKSLSVEDRETAQALLEYYRKIQSALATEVSETYYREITHQLFDGMLLLENRFVVND